MLKFRWIALLLAIGGCYWAFILVGLLSAENVWGFLLLFGPGYLVTFGYVVRAIWNVRVGWRRFIWIFSALVQGAWLVVVGYSNISSGLQMTPDRLAVLIWWSTATIASVYGAIADIPKREKWVECSSATS